MKSVTCALSVLEMFVFISVKKVGGLFRSKSLVID
ncbi:hypothetical protein MFUL124B02_36080 [Myxococcus fulvus 124B02]|nr:hypothetical protein MFUL124B02_36080 [Myxococcus fulvus 124B02]